MTNTTDEKKVEVESLPRIELVYLYRHLNAKGEVTHAWGEDRGEGKVRYYAGDRGKNVAEHASPGGVYSFPDKGNGVIVTGREVAHIESLTGPKVVDWAAKDRAIGQEIAAIRQQKQAKRNDPLKVALKPVRDAYRNLPSVQRSQLLAWVVYHITGSGKD